MLTHRLLFIFFLLSYTLVSAQLNTEIDSKSDFDNGIELLKKEHKKHRLNWGYTIADEYYTLVSSTQKWANNSGSISDRILAEYYTLEYTIFSKNQDLALPKDYFVPAVLLLNKPEMQKLPESLDLACDILVKYNRHKENLEIVKFYPLIKELIAIHKSPSYYPLYTVYELVANAHFNLGYYSQAIRTYKNVLSVISSKGRRASFYNNIGLAFYEMGQPDSAMFYYNNSKQTLNDYAEEIEKEKRKEATKSGLTYSTIDYKNWAQNFTNTIESNIADVNLDKGNYKQSLATYLKEIRINDSKPYLGYKAMSASKIAEVYYLMGDLSQARIYLDTVGLLSSKMKNPRAILTKKYLLQKAKIALASNEKQVANGYFKAYQNFNDSIKRKDAEIIFENTNTGRELEKQQYKNTVAQENIELAKKNSLLQWIGIILISIVTIILGITARNLSKDKKTIASQKAEVDRSLRVKSMLLKEVHHRVKNNLQAISSLLTMHSSKIKNEDFSKLVADSKNHIHSMSLVHQMLYQQDDFSIIYSKEFINKLTSNLLKTRGEKDIALYLECENIELPIDKAIPMGLLLTELITNSLKHAFDIDTGQIGILLSTKGKEITLRYSDDGKGMLGTIANNATKSVGFKLIKLLAEEMNATHNMTNKQGLIFTFTFILN